MGYTWTDGELITATKLNNTGGGGYDAVILLTHANDSSADLKTSLTPSIISGSYDGIRSKISNNEYPVILVQYYHPWGYYGSLDGLITYVGATSINIDPTGYFPVDAVFKTLSSLQWGSDDTIAWY